MSFVLLLLCVAFLLLLAVDLLTVLLSYSICWYEYANADPTLIDRRFSSTSLKLTLALILPELFFNLVTVLVIPFGLLNSKNHYMQRGETPVLLLHGLFDNQASWFWFKRKLKQQGIGNVVSLNLSSWHNEEVLTELLAKRVDELRHQLGVNRVHLVGHSMGGMIAAEMAAVAPNDVEKLALICPAGIWLDDHPIPDLFALLPYELPPLLFHDVEAGTKLMTAGLDLGDPEFLKAYLVQNARQLGMAGKILFPIPDRGLSDRLYRIKAQTTLIWGDSDKLIPPVYAQEFKKLIPNSSLVSIPEASHMVPIEQTEQVVAAIAKLAG